MSNLCKAAAAASRSSCAVLGALALVAASASVAAAGFGPQTILGDFYHQTSDVTSPDGLANGACTGVTSCFIVFQPAPNNRKIFADRVSCQITHAAAFTVLANARVRTANNQLPLRLWDVAFFGGPGTTFVNANVRLPLKAGERLVFSVTVHQAANIAGRCSLSGEIVP